MPAVRGSIGIVAVVDDAVGDVHGGIDRLGCAVPAPGRRCGADARRIAKSTRAPASVTTAWQASRNGSRRNVLRVRRRGKVLGSRLHLDDALAAATRPPARGRHQEGVPACVVEERPGRAAVRPAGRRRASRFPGTAVVDLVVAGAEPQFASDPPACAGCGSRTARCTGRSGSCRGSAASRGRRPCHHRREDLADAVEPLAGTRPGRSAQPRDPASISSLASATHAIASLP